MHFLTLHLICILRRSRKIYATSSVKLQIFLSKNRKLTFSTANRKYKFFSGPSRTLNLDPAANHKLYTLFPHKANPSNQESNAKIWCATRFFIRKFFLRKWASKESVKKISASNA